jgi:hypothetical protein
VRPLCQELLNEQWVCSRPAVWQRPTDRIWLCEEHAASVRVEVACEECGEPGAWQHPRTKTWLCLEHRPAA